MVKLLAFEAYADLPTVQVRIGPDRSTDNMLAGDLVSNHRARGAIRLRQGRERSRKETTSEVVSLCKFVRCDGLLEMRLQKLFVQERRG